MLDYLIFRCYWQHDSNQHQTGREKSKSDTHDRPLSLLLLPRVSLFSLQFKMSTPIDVRRLLWLRGIFGRSSHLDYRAERHRVGYECWHSYEGAAPSSIQDYSGGREWSQSQQSSIENHVYVGCMNHNTSFQKYLRGIFIWRTPLHLLAIYKVLVECA